MKCPYISPIFIVKVIGGLGVWSSVGNNTNFSNIKMLEIKRTSGYRPNIIRV
ncbi:unnamed protein product [Meloidogyne enterolobii]|uniref:Uncharacterized protein n=1 Tax=Meloidogyne enterolobii TaxID=390850 RepID=A0ACB0YVC4_MELEN